MANFQTTTFTVALYAIYDVMVSHVGGMAIIDTHKLHRQFFFLFLFHSLTTNQLYMGERDVCMCVCEYKMYPPNLWVLSSLPLR